MSIRKDGYTLRETITGMLEFWDKKDSVLAAEMICTTLKKRIEKVHPRAVPLGDMTGQAPDYFQMGFGEARDTITRLLE